MPYRLNTFLSPGGELALLTRKAHLLMALDRHLEHLIPPSLKRACRVAQYDRYTLTLTADNGAIAAKLRQMSSNLVSQLQEIPCEVTSIRVLVQVSTHQYQKPSEPRTLSISAKSRLVELADSLSESPLKRAVERLAHRKRN